MSLQIAKYLMRAVLILLMFQFVAPAFIEVPVELDRSEYSSTLHKDFSRSFFDISLFEIEEKESEEDEKPFTSLLLLDFSELHSYCQSALQINSLANSTSQHHLQAPSLLKLFCVFII